MRKSPTTGVTVREIRDELPKSRRERSTALGLFLFMISLTGYLATLVIALFVAEWWFKVAASVANGLFISTLFILGHDACHGSLTASSRLNGILGRVAFLPSLQPYTAWAFSHNGRHHGWTNLKGQDPVYAPLSKDEYDSLRSWQQQLHRIYRTIPGLAVIYFIEIYLKHEIFPVEADRPKRRLLFATDRALVICFLILELSLSATVSIHSTGSIATALTVMLIAVVVPFCIWNWISGFVTFQHHTNPKIAWFNRVDEWTFYQGQILGTTHVVMKGWIGSLLHNIFEHTAHHVDPLIPLYNLPSSQKKLNEKFDGDIVEIPWTLREFVKTLRCCKLYDYVNHRWLDFEGNITSDEPARSLRTGKYSHQVANGG